MKVIFKYVTGSRLYGTNTPESDTDYIGVFIPEVEEFLGLSNPPDQKTENKKISSGPRNGKDDIDCTYKSVREFLKLAAQGQSAQVEMLFAPPEMVLATSPIWEKIQKNRHLLLSQKSLGAVVGFAIGQAHKAMIKGDNLRLISKLLQVSKNKDPNFRIEDFLLVDEENKVAKFIDVEVHYGNYRSGRFIEVAGRRFPIGLKIKTFRETLLELHEKYGTRSQEAALDTYDFKSVLHAVRTLQQAEEFLLTGNLTLPRPEKDLEELMKIRRKEWPAPDFDFIDYVNKRADELRKKVEESSPLPKEPDWSKIEALCVEIMTEHFKGGLR